MWLRAHAIKRDPASLDSSYLYVRSKWLPCRGGNCAHQPCRPTATPRVVVGLLAAALVAGPLSSSWDDVSAHGWRAVNLLGGANPISEFGQDYIGAAALISDVDAYPILTEAHRDVLGIDFHAGHRSTHPPTAFLFALPFLALPWTTVVVVWGWLMLACMVVSTWAVGFRWPVAVALAPVWPLWAPTAGSLGQFTPLWLLGIALAWRWRDHAWLSGVAIGGAALTKGFAFVVLLVFVGQRRWRPVVAAAAVAFTAIAVVMLLDAGVLNEYLADALPEGAAQIQRMDNGSPLVVAGRAAGVPGVIAVAGLAISATVVAMRGGERAWLAATWLSVALLPVVWLYSLLPLAPPLVRQVQRGGRVATVAASVALVVPFAVPQAGTMPFLVAVATVAAGIAVVADGVRSPSAPLRRDPLAKGVIVEKDGVEPRAGVSI